MNAPAISTSATFGSLPSSKHRNRRSAARAPGQREKQYKSAFSYNFVGAALGIKLPVPSTPPGDCAATRSCSRTLSVAGQLLADQWVR
jgi:hypothetical protein